MLNPEEAALRASLIERFKPTCKRKRTPKPRRYVCYKARFSKREAETVLNQIKKKEKHDKRRKENRIYHCPICNTWHLTSKDKVQWKETN